MIYLALGSLLLAGGAIGQRARQRSVDALTFLAIAVFLAFAAGATRVYPPGTEAEAIAAGIALAIVGRLIVRDPTPALRWLALALGTASGLYALLGPAGGLF